MTGFNAQISSNSLPPQNIEAEESILGGILLDPEAMGQIVDILVAEAFYVKAHQEIYQAMLVLHAQGKPTDLMAVTVWLSDRGELDRVGGTAKLAQLLNRTVSAANIDRYATLIMDKYIRRELIAAGHEIVDLGYQTAEELETVLDESGQKIFRLTQEKPQQGLVPIADTLIQTFNDIESLHEQTTLPGIPCGFYDLDAMTSGFGRSDLIIVAGRPSMGKTSFALNIACNIAGEHRLPVAIFSLEMSKEQLAQRLLSGEAKIESNRLRSGRFSQNEYEPLVNAVAELSDLPIFIDDTASLSVTQMRSQLRRLQSQQKKHIGLVLLDYLQLMEGGSDNRVQELSKITRSLKGLAREFNVPIIALSQLSRGVEQRTNKRPMMSDLRESGCLTGDSLVTLADNGIRVPIRELVGQSGFAVWALNENKMQLEKAIASKVFFTGIKPILRLTTRLGRKIRATGNHKFLTINGWCRLDELVVKQHLCLPRYIPSPDAQTMTYAEVALLGHLIGDGCTLPRHFIQYTTKEIDLVTVTGKPDFELFIQKIRAVGEYKLGALQQISEHLENCVHNTNRDIIPKDIWRTKVVPEMQAIGMTTRVLHSSLETSYSGSTLYKANLSRNRALKVSNIVRSEKLFTLANSDVYWDEIVSIEPDGEEEVFDLTVPELHNFVANNIIVHNSIEQDADLIIMLYRDSYYNPDSPDRNIAEVLIVKHRNGPTGTVKLLFQPELTKFENLAKPHDY
jgi:replicative DNA helicase